MVECKINVQTLIAFESLQSENKFITFEQVFGAINDQTVNTCIKIVTKLNQENKILKEKNKKLQVQNDNIRAYAADIGKKRRDDFENDCCIIL